ncbi:hypothetical protein D9M72_639260 [compost metagenome]
MDHLRRLGRCAEGEVVLFHQRHAVAAQAGIERRIGAGDAAADDQHVELLVGQARELFLPVQPQRFGGCHLGPVFAGPQGWQNHHEGISPVEA